MCLKCLQCLQCLESLECGARIRVLMFGSVIGILAVVYVDYTNFMHPNVGKVRSQLRHYLGPFLAAGFSAL